MDESSLGARAIAISAAHDMKPAQVGTPQRDPVCNGGADMTKNRWLAEASDSRVLPN
jgi:hypothetical protein